MLTHDIDQLSDDAILERLGQRVARYRLNRNLTQEQIALLEARGKERLRASGSRERSPSSVAEQPGAWTWPDEHT